MIVTTLTAIPADDAPEELARIAAPRGSIATFGVFDGVHRGHRHLLSRVVAAAREAKAPALVITFAVHPVAVLRGLPPRSITSLPHRLRLFSDLGFDACVVLPFDETVRDLDADTFARRIFVRGLGIRGWVLGPDARIGKDRRGDRAFFERFAAAHGLSLEFVEPFAVAGEPISSTRIRAAITDGDLDRARAMLGREVSLYGTVVAGDGRGAKLGFPTANLDLHHEIRPPLGVYAVRARIDGRQWDGVLNVGIRPTFGPDGDLTVEAHLFDFAGNLYGRDLELVLVKRLRAEKKFGSRDELVAQIARDCEAAKEVLRAT
jgi:riboflavin kinase/FMN adenylyltransferase